MPTRFKEKKYHEGDHMLEEVTQRGCRVSVLANIQNSAGRGCEQLAVVDPSFHQGIEPNGC